MVRDAVTAELEQRGNHHVSCKETLSCRTVLIYLVLITYNYCTQ